MFTGIKQRVYCPRLSILRELWFYESERLHSLLVTISLSNYEVYLKPSRLTFQVISSFFDVTISVSNPTNNIRVYPTVADCSIFILNLITITHAINNSKTSRKNTRNCLFRHLRELVFLHYQRSSINHEMSKIWYSVNEFRFNRHRFFNKNMF